MVKFESTTDEHEAIRKIVDRAFPEFKKHIPDVVKLDVMMDLDAANSNNGYKLDFARLLEFPDFDFYHDVFGIYSRIDRRTGIVGDCFLPRCAVSRL